MAKRNNLWDESKGYLNFREVYGLPRAHSTYATRRVWRVFSLVAPSLNLPAVNGAEDNWGNAYPFSVPAERKLSPRDLMRIQVHSNNALCLCCAIDPWI